MDAHGGGLPPSDYVLATTHIHSLASDYYERHFRAASVLVSALPRAMTILYTLPPLPRIRAPPKLDMPP